MQTLIDYIASNYSGSQTAFAADQGVQLPQVTQWISKKFIVVDGVLHSPRRILNKEKTMAFNTEQRKSIKNQAKDKTIEQLEYVALGEYWVMTFTDGTEFSFRFMAELV